MTVPGLRPGASLTTRPRSSPTLYLHVSSSVASGLANVYGVAHSHSEGTPTSATPPSVSFSNHNIATPAAPASSSRRDIRECKVPDKNWKGIQDEPVDKAAGNIVVEVMFINMAGDTPAAVETVMRLFSAPRRTGHKPTPCWRTLLRWHCMARERSNQGAAGVKATVTGKNTDAESEQENESETESESEQPDEGDKDKDAKIKKLEADVQTMRDQLASSKASYSEKERELKAVLDQLEEEKATSANLRYETEQSGEEQKDMLLELEGFRESPLYKVNDFVVVRGNANDGDDTVPWFAKVVAVNQSKRRLTLRWHVPNEEGVYTRETKGGKDLKDDSARFDDIVSTVQMSKDMKLPVEEFEKAWEALKQATE
ncbi:Hypp6203 [Branchiostoma lanceolatum]|uniref:Hypp6203 protein n=1 Tax=Branchiostoma lanceolatum TaxID=7740 RepID=A0A8J9VK26_BRALA|nr:Hypp6203 [Branchiostoma lanceolatum]